MRLQPVLKAPTVSKKRKQIREVNKLKCIFSLVADLSKKTGVSDSLNVQIRILESEEIEHSIQADGVDALLGIGYNTWFGMESNAKTSQ